MIDKCYSVYTINIEKLRVLQMVLKKSKKDKSTHISKRNAMTTFVMVPHLFLSKNKNSFNKGMPQKNLVPFISERTMKRTI
jgi:hypothetical protein